MKKLLSVLLISATVLAAASCSGNPSNIPEASEPPVNETTNTEETLETGETKSELDPETLMWYKLNDDGNSYTVSPSSSLPDVIKELVIPGEYKGLPVTKVDGGLGERSIETVIISEGIKEIRTSFDFCTDIKNIYIPASVVYIMRGTFNCRATMGGHGRIKSNVIEKIVVAEGNPCYYVDGNCLIEKSSQKIILGCNSSAIPTDGSVKSIGYAAFANCHLIETVILPKSIIEIETSAFDNCDHLKKVYITSSVSEDHKVVNFDPEPVFGHDPLDMLYVPDAESLELYSKFLGEAYFNIGTPFDRIVSIEAAERIARDHWAFEINSTEQNSNISFSVPVLVRLHGDIYVVNLEKHLWDGQHWSSSIIDSIVIDAYAGKVIDAYTDGAIPDATPLISSEDAIKLAYTHWNLPSDSTKDNFSIPVRVSTSFDDSGYHVYLQRELINHNFSTIAQMDLNDSFDHLSHSEVREYACRYWKVKEDSMGQYTISSVSLSVERIGHDYRINMIWNDSNRTQVLIDWVYFDIYTGEGSVG